MRTNGPGRTSHYGLTEHTETTGTLRDWIKVSVMHQQLIDADIPLSLLLSLFQESELVTGQASLLRLFTDTPTMRTQERTPKAHTVLES